MSSYQQPIHHTQENKLNPPPKVKARQKSDKEFFAIIREINRLSGSFKNRNATIGIWDSNGRLHNRQKVLVSLRWMLKHLTINRKLLGEPKARKTYTRKEK